MTHSTKRVLALLFLFAAAGCATRFGRANDLAKEGKFVEAAELFEQLAKETPTDAELPKLMERARFRAVEHALTRARQFRMAADTQSSQRYFAEALELRRRWNVKLNGALEETVEDERNDATTRLRALVLPHAQKGEGLTAQTLVKNHGFLLQHEELAALRKELTDASASSGASTCAGLRKDAKAAEPYWAWVVAEYCRHFGADAPREWPLPHTFSTARSTIAVAQLSDGISGALDGQLLARARSGPWFSERGPLTAMVSTRGAASVNQRQAWVTLSAGWVEQVPYVEHVTKTVQQTVPVTECESYEESSSTAPGGKISRTREVTRNKTSSKQVVVPETRFRDVPRSFEYPALRIERALSFSGRTELQVGDQTAAVAGQELNDTRQGYSHDVVFPAANVRPTRPDFPPAEGWLEANASRLAEAFSAGMREGWRARFCTAPGYSIEDAARCARAAEKVPAEAIEALKAKLGEDAAQIPKLLAGPG